jgi:uncharacterized protein (DUF58 family)
VRPSGRALRNSFLVIAGLVGLAVVTGDVWLLLLACLAVGALIVDAGLPWPGACLHVGITCLPRTRVGEVVEFKITVTDAGTRPSRPCVLRIRSPLLDISPMHVAALQPGERVAAQVSGRVIRRGVVDTLEIETVKGGLLGLLTWTGLGSRHLDLVAAPAPAPAWTVVESPGLTLTPGGRPVVRPGGIEVHGVRDWRPGDPSRHVHWRSTARRGRLVVTDRFDEVGGDLVLVLAPPAADPGLADPAWEEVVARVAATAEATLAAGGTVSLVAAIHGVPDLVARDPEAVLDWCARLPAADTVLPLGDEMSALDRARRVVGPGGRELVVRTPAAAARRAHST